jgi:hypothetical protein
MIKLYLTTLKTRQPETPEMHGVLLSKPDLDPGLVVRV